MTTHTKMRSGSSARRSSRKAAKQTFRAFDICWKGAIDDYVTALAWSPQASALAGSAGAGSALRGGVLAAGSASGDVLLWSELQSAVLNGPENQYSINGLGFSADGRYLAAAGQQGTVFIWQMETIAANKTAASTIENPHCWIDCLEWHPSKAWLAFGAGNQIRVWDAEQQQIIAEKDFAASSVLALAWHPSGDLLAVSGHTGVKVWGADNWSASPTFIEVPGASMSVAWSADGQYLASGNLDKTLTVVNWENPPPWLMQGFPGKVRQVAWTSAIGKHPIVAAACAEGITVWQRQGKNWQSDVLEKHQSTVAAIAFHPSQPLLASAAQDGRLCLWQNANSLQQTIKGTAAGFSAIAWHPKGDYLAAGGAQGEVIICAPSSRGRGFQ